MVGVDDDGRIGQVPLAIGFVQALEVFIMVVRHAVAEAVDIAAQDGGLPVVRTSQPRNRNSCECWAASMELSMTEMSPDVGFFMPTGMPTPLAIMRWNWSSTDRAPTRHRTRGPTSNGRFPDRGLLQRR